MDDVSLLFEAKGSAIRTDTYRSKPEIAAQMVREIKQMGFEIELVLADSLYGESESNFGMPGELKLNFVVAIRRNHGVWLPRTNGSLQPMAKI